MTLGTPPLGEAEAPGLAAGGMTPATALPLTVGVGPVTEPLRGMNGCTVGVRDVGMPLTCGTPAARGIPAGDWPTDEPLRGEKERTVGFVPRENDRMLGEAGGIDERMLGALRGESDGTLGLLRGAALIRGETEGRLKLRIEPPDCERVNDREAPPLPLLPREKERALARSAASAGVHRAMTAKSHPQAVARLNLVDSMGLLDSLRSNHSGGSRIVAFC